MVSNEAWMGSGTYVTMAPESELFLGYNNPGPTLGLSGTDKAHLIRYGVGWEVDGKNGGITVGTTKMFSDYYELVPDLYTGCIAKFYYTETAADPTLQHTAIVAGNDKDGLYFAGNIADFKILYNTAADASSGNPRGYIILESHGSVVPAPITLEALGSVGVTAADDDFQDDTNASKLSVGDAIYNQAGALMGRLVAVASGANGLKFTNDTTIDAVTVPSGADSEGQGTYSSLASTTVGVLQAGDWVCTVNGGTHTKLGIVLYTTSTSFTYAYLADGTTAHDIYRGTDALVTSTSEHTPKQRVLSDNWLGITNTVTPSNPEVEMKQVNLALGGTRNYTYQYKGIETAGAASLDIDLNHGSWLYYALGNMSLSATATTGTDMTSVFRPTASTNVNTGTAWAVDNATVWVGYDNADSSAGSTNGKMHRVMHNTNVFCPPVLPGNGASPLTAVPLTTDSSTFLTYTFSERNDNFLPSFAMELSTQKGSTLTAEPMVDRNTYNNTMYAQLYPGCMVNSLTLSANENEALKATLDLNVKRVFECPNGYVARAYDATYNDTNEFKNLFNFGNIKNKGGHASSAELTQEFIDPFYFSDGTISMFGQEFMKVQTMSLTMNNTLTDKRYIGQYNKQIKHAVPAQRTYEITMTAQVTDRRIFDELRSITPDRVALGDSQIQLLFTKANGERVKLQFDDYMVSAASWPLAEDRGPIYVDFTVLPLRAGTTMDALSAWVMQS